MGWWFRPSAFNERNRDRYGKSFTVRLVGSPPFVIHSDPDLIKEIFSASPEVLHPGEGARILEPIVGSNSLILLDEKAHLEQRKLLLPAFHGEMMQRLAGLMEDVAEQEVASWPRDETVQTHARFQDLTLEIILRAVFGLDPGRRLDELRSLLTQMMEFGTKWGSMIPQLRKDFLGLGISPFPKFVALRERADKLIFELIHERRGEESDRDDVLAMLLAARHEDDSPMSDQELRDELLTMLVAGHETTASELAWAFERLARERRVLDTLVAEIDADDGDAYLTATIQETLRRRPVLPNAEPRLVMEPFELGGWTYPEGCCLVANAYLLHHDPDVYPDPYVFRPERFLEEPPGTYTWIPFGGGRRRCIGASFATLEMKIVLRAVLRRCTIEPGTRGDELARRRMITVSPKQGAPTVIRDREPSADPAPDQAPAAVA